jgi:bis(5'-nucleosyl)-tetraphosphatase (symmetrical)
VFVGDIQGCADELDDLLESLRFDPPRDRLYAVGDVVNRGPRSAAVVRRLRELGAVTVLGNHELHLFEIAAGRRQPKGRDTAQELLDDPDGGELLVWLRARPFVHVEDDVILVHAGLHPAWPDPVAWAAELRRRFEARFAEDRPLDDPLIRFAVSVRFCDAAGTLPATYDPPPAAPFRPWFEHYVGSRTVVFGHWAQRGLVRADRLRGLDTGCVYGHTLTAWIAEEDRIVQVRARRAYCPL